MKNYILKKYKTKIAIVGLLVIGLVAGLAIATLPSQLESFRKSKVQAVQVKEAELKKQALAKFYKELTDADVKHDWIKSYNLQTQSIKRNVTEAQYLFWISGKVNNSGIISLEYVVHGIQVEGNKGIVDRTRITCLSKECIGDKRKEDNAKIEYSFVNEKWQLPDPEPSERALKAANYGYENSSKSDQKDLLVMFGNGSESSSFAVRNWALSLDKNLQELVRIETIIDKDKADKNRPVVNYQPPNVIVQPPTIIQQPATPTHCTSYPIGDYRYTNCY